VLTGKGRKNYYAGAIQLALANAIGRVAGMALEDPKLCGNATGSVGVATICNQFHHEVFAIRPDLLQAVEEKVHGTVVYRPVNRDIGFVEQTLNAGPLCRRLE
jgi:hypothetical protein